jgi:hypothetical protein
VPDLSFKVNGVAAIPFAAAPTLAFRLEVANTTPRESIHSVALRCQLQLEVTRRQYTAEEKSALCDLFGEPARWGQTLRPILWTHLSTVVPGFTDNITVDLQTPCTFDFNVAATKYFYGVQEGDVPVCVQFSGTVYYQSASGMLQVAPISWDKECRFRLPVRVWRDMMESYYPNSAWLCLGRDAFERLYRYKVEHGIPTWEQAIESILAAVEKVGVS